MADKARKIFNIDRIRSTRLALRAAAFATLGAMASFGGCALLVGGLHGMVIVSALTALLGVALGSVAVVAGAVTDSTRAVGEALRLWEPVVPGEVEIGAGQLSVSEPRPSGAVSVASGGATESCLRDAAPEPLPRRGAGAHHDAAVGSLDRFEGRNSD